MRAISSDLPIVLNGVSLMAGATTILDQLNLTIGRGGPTLIVGPNGSGKTSLLRLCMGLAHPAQGPGELGRADGWRTWTARVPVPETGHAATLGCRKSCLCTFACRLPARFASQSHRRIASRCWPGRTGAAPCMPLVRWRAATVGACTCLGTSARNPSARRTNGQPRSGGDPLGGEDNPSQRSIRDER
jgi:energy-coupling factor transporter ATP-binding protein EcfA2